MKNANTQMATRRTLIQSAALLTAGASIFKSRYSSALTPALAPKRVVFVFIPGGASPQYWPARGCGNNFSLPAMSAPLEPIKQHLVFLNNLRMTRGGHGNTYNALGGWYSPDRGTLDVELAASLQKNTPIAQLTLSAGELYDPSVSKTVGAATQPLYDPLMAYKLLFDGLPAAQKSVLDDNFVGDSSAIRRDFDKLSNLHLELAVLALQRNKTNIATVMLGSDQMGFTIPGTVGSFPYIHMIESGSSADFVRGRAYLTQKFTYLVKLLEGTLDSNNKSLLDSTLVVMVSDMGNGADFTLDNAPFLLAGAKDFLHGNRLLDVSGRTHLDFLDTVSALLGASGALYGKGPIADILV